MKANPISIVNRRNKSDLKKEDPESHIKEKANQLEENNFVEIEFELEFCLFNKYHIHSLIFT